MQTWHVIVNKEEGRAAANFISDKGSAGTEEARMVRKGPPHLHCLLPTP